MNKEKLLELSDTLRGIAEGKEWEVRKWTWFAGLWDSPECGDPLSALEQGYEIRLKPQQPPPDPYAELKAAHAAGKVIQWRFNDAMTWMDKLANFDDYPDNCDFRIKPEPQKLPLCPNDVKSGDEFLSPQRSRYQWSYVNSAGVAFEDDDKTWRLLCDDGWKIRSIGETEWRPCYKLVEQ